MVPPLVRLRSHGQNPHGVRQRHPLYRAYPSGPIVIRHFRAGRSGRYFGVFSDLLSPAGDSLAEDGRLLHPVVAFHMEYEGILAENGGFVKGFMENNLPYHPFLYRFVK